MFKEIGSRVNLPELELGVLGFWKENDIFRKSLQLREDRPRYVFYEGPPTANGRPGIHHVLARVFKDLFPRYHTMKGRYVARKGGWDTHGLPVELEVEKELGISSKREIEAFGVAAFNARCRESVFRYVRDWVAMTERIGFWIDMDDPYVTYHNSYIETGWWIVKQLWDRGLVYQDYKVTPYCARCGTSLSSHEVALGYDDNTVDPSVYVKFRARPAPGHRLASFLHGDLPTYFLAWTTTPWTLPGNAALAVAPEAEYVVARLGEERLILAGALAQAALGPGFEVEARVPGSDLVGLTYEPLYSWLSLPTPAHRLIGADFVSLEDGTGIVHTAPAFGEVDLEIGRKEGLPVIVTVDLKGEIIPEGGPWAGMFVKDADPHIMEDLRRRGLLHRAETITHTYPFCWRCSTPLLYYAKTSWYIRTTAVKEKMLAGNEIINWYPEHIKWGRFGEWLRGNVDWAVSRERYWGTPLPIWRCETCGTFDCVGSVAELRDRAEDPDRVSPKLDLHRPYIDEVTLHCQCGGSRRRIPEVIDCWFDSGAMPVAQWHFPFEKQGTFVESFPADFICEAIDQTRGWFYSLHALSTLLFNRPCYQNVICLGLVLDGKGEKMSKSRGNVVDPWVVLNEHGADAVRWYLFTANQPGLPRRFSTELVGEVVRKFLLTLWNTYSFFVTYANIDGWTPAAGEGEPSELDRWVLSELHHLVADVTRHLDNYDPTTAGRAIGGFVDDLSNWYVRRSRRRFWKSGHDADKLAAYATLHQCLTTLSRLLAPFTPFVAEELHQNLVRSVNPAAPESVHLTDFPVADRSRLDERLMVEMRVVMKVVSLGRAARSKAQLKVRQPLAQVRARVRTAEEEAGLRRLAPLVLDELNVKDLQTVSDASQMVEYDVKPNLPLLGPRLGKELGPVIAALRAQDPPSLVAAVRAGGTVRIGSYELAAEEILVEARPRAGLAVAEEAGYVVALPTEVTPELREEGLARELVHRLQTMRKSAGFNIADYITTYFEASEGVRGVLERYADYVQAETLSRRLLEGPPPAEAYQETHRLDGESITLAVVRET